MPSPSSRRPNCSCRSARRATSQSRRPLADGGDSQRQNHWRHEPLGGRRHATAHSATPATHLLSNGRYAVMLTAAGSGYSRWRDLAVTRWREDADLRRLGLLRLSEGRRAAARSGRRLPADRRRARRLRGRPSTRTAPNSVRRDGALTTTLEVLVSAEDDARSPARFDLQSRQPRRARSRSPPTPNWCWRRQAADVAHPAFSKLFVETEYLADLGAILATRRRRTPTEPEIWAAHLAVVDGEAVGKPRGRNRPGPLPRPRPRASARRSR